MKFLQTGDLHLGKFFYEYQLLEDQKYVLNQLINELKLQVETDSPYDALIIAGDIYDRSMPPAEAVQVFSEFLAKIQKAFQELHVLIIPGNHDSALRLSYAQQILEQQRIHIRTDLTRIDEPVIIKDTAFYLMPFLQPASFSLIEQSDEKTETKKNDKKLEKQKKIQPSKTSLEKNLDLFSNVDENQAENKTDLLLKDNSEKKETFLMSQTDLAKEAIRRINISKNEDIPSVLVAHLFTAGSVESDSERIIWGTAEQVDNSLFKDFSYTALGHLHRCQQAGSRAFYSGSPLAYSFGESNTDKVFLRIELEKNKEPIVTKIPIEPLHPVISLTGSFEEFFDSEKYDKYKNHFLEIVSMTETIIENPVALLRKKFPYLLSFRQDKAFERIASKEIVNRRLSLSNNENNINEQFVLFLEEIYSSDTDFTEKKALFDKLFAEMKEKNHETK
ncbi:MAG: exonuclease subunit SbcD [Treponema sp.]|jgi:exonuclease SbcD|nr:exonuclease subunit SbcD [Treponema sp.]